MGNTAGQRHPHHEDMPPPVSNNQPDASLLVVRPACGPGSLPARIHEDGSGTPGVPPPTWPCRASGEKGGVAPVLSLSAGAVRVVRYRTRNPNNDSEKTMGGVGHPPLCYWYTPPPVCVPFCSTPAVTPVVTPEGSRQRGAVHPPRQAITILSTPVLGAPEPAKIIVAKTPN